MLTNSPALRVLVILFAIIGAFVVVVIVGMAVMYGSMMAMMGSEQIAAMCQGMMGKSSLLQ